MKKTYMKPQMEAIEIKMQGMIAASDVKNVKGDLGFTGGGAGGGRAPMMPDFEEGVNDFDDFMGGFKLW